MHSLPPLAGPYEFAAFPLDAESYHDAKTTIVHLVTELL